MKKSMYFIVGLFFLAGTEAISCAANHRCAGSGQTITCTGSATCSSGSGWVECTDTDGGSSFNTCPMT
jgi:hypothetical protein